MRGAPLLLLLAGCAAQPPLAGAGQCRAEPAQTLLGHAATRELAARAMKLSGARAMRWIRPGMAVTMDYREDRLNIEINDAEQVISIRCG